MEDLESQNTQRPRLWNPNAAALWSLLFSPAFGAILHAMNWRELGKPAEAKANMAWAYASFVFLFLNLASVFFESRILDMLFKFGALAMLIAWYLTQGRKHVAYVNENFQEFERKGWGKPLLIALGAFLGYLIAIFAFSFAYFLLFSSAEV